MPNLNPLELMEMLGKIYPHQSGATEQNTQIEQKMSAQRAYMDRLKIENDNFFNLLNLLFAQQLEASRLKQGLQEAAQRSGFDNVQHALNYSQNQYGQSPLQQAFQQQDFSKAKQLIDYGAVVGPVERATFDVALDSKAAEASGFKRPVTDKIHPVKNFGVTLGIEMTSKDGTFSQIAHVGPTYKIMADSVSKYASKEPEFKEISAAFDFSNKAAGFSASTAKGAPLAGEKIAARIQEGKVTTIPVSCQGHAMGLSIVPDKGDSNSGYMVFTNRGIGADVSGTKIYRIDDLSKVDAKFINSMMNGHSDKLSHDAVMAKIAQVADNKPPIHMIEQQAQKRDNCTIANPRANIQGILLCQKAVEKNGFANLDAQDHQEVKTSYKKFTSAMRSDKADELVSAMAKNPKDADLSNLAKEYLKQHPNADFAIRDKLEKAITKVSEANVRNEQRYEPPLSAPR